MSWGVSGLSVSYDGRTALRDVTLDLEPGRITAVVGGDGAGKTTLARVLGRLIGHDSGTVRLPDRRSVGYQPASSGSWPDLTVAENLQFAADAYRIAPDDARDRFSELLDATDLGEAVDRLAGDLSGGMRQKLGVAMALMPEPRLLVLDEPTTGVDPVSRSELWRLVSNTAAGGTAVFFTTTYLDEAERAASLLALDDGVVVAQGSPDEIRVSVRGEVWGSLDRPVAEERWRRGSEWRVWTADGSRPDGAEPIEADMTDLITAATLAREGRPDG